MARRIPVAAGLIFRIVQIHGNNAFQRLESLFGEIIFGDGHIILLDLSTPRRSAPWVAFRIGPFHNQFRSCVTMDGPMELILYLRKKQPRCFGRLVIIQRSGIDVGDLLVEPALRHPNLLALY